MESNFVKSWKLEANIVKSWKLEAEFVKSWKLEADFGKIWKLEAGLKKNESGNRIWKNLGSCKAFSKNLEVGI